MSLDSHVKFTHWNLKYYLYRYFVNKYALRKIKYSYFYSCVNKIVSFFLIKTIFYSLMFLLVYNFIATNLIVAEQTGDLQSSSDISQHPLSPNNDNFVDKSLIKQKKTESMRRIKQFEKWKVNMKKNARLKGEEYTGVGG